MAETAAPQRPVNQVEPGAAHGEDFFLWTQRQAALIRARRFDLVDWENIALEIETMGSRERRELGTRLKILMMHLLNWQFQPERRSRSWRSTINDQRDEIEQLLEEDPSLRREVEALIGKRYRIARANAAGESGLALRTFPSRCPYAADHILDEAYFPVANDDE